MSNRPLMIRLSANTIQNFPLNGLDISALTFTYPAQYSGDIGYHQHRAKHLLHRFGEPERKSRPGEQLHARWNRYEPGWFCGSARAMGWSLPSTTPTEKRLPTAWAITA